MAQTAAEAYGTTTTRPNDFDQFFNFKCLLTSMQHWPARIWWSRVDVSS